MSLGQMIKYSLSKLLYEVFGTMIITMLFIEGSQSVILAGYWIMTIFCWRISGSHFNPAISLVYIFRKDKGGLPRTLALCYAVAQCIGALCGASLMNFLDWQLAPMDVNKGITLLWPRAVTQEALGSFVLVFFFMT